MQLNNEIVVDMICDLLEIRCGFAKTPSLRSQIKNHIGPILSKSKINQDFHPMEGMDDWETSQDVVEDPELETSHERQLEIRQKMAPESSFFKDVLRADMDKISKEIELTKKISDLFGGV